MIETGLLKKLFHPNRISLYGTTSTAIGTGLLMNASTMPYGAALVAGGYLSDYIDGKIAKNYDMKTLEGASLDPLMDKVKNVLVGGYVGVSEILRGGVFLPVAIGANFAVDYISQKSRGSVLDQIGDSCNAVWDPDSCHKDIEIDSKLRANIFGKAKTAIQAVANLGYIGIELVNNFSDKIDMDYAAPVLASALVVSAGLGIKGILGRRKI